MKDLPKYSPVVFRRGLALIMLPCMVGLLTLFLLSQQWFQTVQTYTTERIETSIIVRLSRAIRNWGVVSELYARQIVSNEEYLDKSKNNFSGAVENDLEEVCVLLKPLPVATKDDYFKTVNELKLLFAKEKQSFEAVAKQRAMIGQLLQKNAVSEINPEEVKSVILSSYRSYCDAKKEEQNIIANRWAKLKSFRISQDESSKSFTLAVALVAVSNVAISVIAAWLVSVPLVRKMQTVRENSEKFLHGDLEKHFLLAADEFTYLQYVLNQSFNRVIEENRHRKLILAMVAHDIRTLLMSANASLNLMEEYCEGLSDRSIDLLMSVYERLRQVLVAAEKILNPDIAADFVSYQSNFGLDRTAKTSYFEDLSPTKTEHRRYFRAGLFQQFVALVILPLIVQLLLLLCISTLSARVEMSIRQARYFADMMMETNITLLNSLIATSEKSSYILSGSPTENIAARLFFRKALAQNLEMIRLAALEDQPTKYPDSIFRELQQIDASLMRQIYTPETATSIKIISDLRKLHYSAAGKMARQLEQGWLRTNLKNLKIASEMGEHVSVDTKNVFIGGIIIYVISEIVVLILFVLTINNRISQLIEIASMVGKSTNLRENVSREKNDEIADLEVALLRLGRHLAETSVIRQDLLNCLSQEMNEPLIEAIDEANQLSTDSEEMLPEKSVSYLQNAIRCVTQVQHVLDDLLIIERLRYGNVLLRREQFDANDLVSKAVLALEPLASLRSIAVTSDCASGALYADKSQMLRVILNLLANAIKFSASGSSVRILGIFCADIFRVEVIDCGPGIAETDGELIFEPRYRVNSSDDHAVGFGLGLAISKLITVAHNGAIGFSSEIGIGTKFWFEIPINNAEIL